MAQKKKRPLQKVISSLVTIVCLAVFIYASSGLFNAFMDYYKNRKMMSEVQDIYYEFDSADTAQAAESNEIRSGFEELLKQNEDVIGWITIDDTQVDYPILHSSDNIEYLTENYYGNQSRAGSIFMDFRNDITSSNLNTVIYGHRMKDGSMFQQLTKFLDQEFFESHRTFEYDTLYESYEAEIFAVYHTLTDFNYIATDFSSDEEYENLLADIQEKSLFQTDIEVSADDPIITLSTCDYKLDADDGRLVVHAKLVKKS